MKAQANRTEAALTTFQVGLSAVIISDASKQQKRGAFGAQLWLILANWLILEETDHSNGASDREKGKAL